MSESMGDRVNTREGSVTLASYACKMPVREDSRGIRDTPKMVDGVKTGTEAESGSTASIAGTLASDRDPSPSSRVFTTPLTPSLRSVARGGTGEDSLRSHLAPDPHAFRIEFDKDAEAYRIDGEEVVRISSVSKVGEDVWQPASAWGWRIGFEGAHALFEQFGSMSLADLEAELKRSELTPWGKRDKAADRGTNVHDALEALIQDGTVPEVDTYSEERRGHVLSLLRWYRRFKPSFVASEVIVGSKRHGFAGRYDLRALFATERLIGALDKRSAATLVRLVPPERLLAPELLGLGDLKTSRKLSPRTWFAQLDGYEEGSIERGYPATDFRFVVKTHEDGSPADMVVSWAPRGLFLAYLGSIKAMAELDAASPAAVERRERAERHAAQEAEVLPALREHGPITRNKLAVKLRPWEPEALGKVLQRLKAQGLASCSGRTWEACDPS